MLCGNKWNSEQKEKKTIISRVVKLYPHSILYSCIDIYVHSCLRPISIGRKPCSNSKTYVQIMKFTCRLNMGFGRRHWSMRRDVMCFVETKWPTLKKLRCFR